MRLMSMLLFCAACLAAEEPPNSLSAKESAEGWKLLFDGRTLNGWEQHWAQNWKADGGALVCSANDRSWLSTSDSFGDYLLLLDFRGAASVNSGVFLRSQ